MTAFNDLKQKTYEKAIAKKLRNGKMHMWNFLFRLRNVKTLHKTEFFRQKQTKKINI